MALADTDLERIGTYVKGNLYGWFVEVAPHLVIGPQILERIATIEQELKDQRELMAVRFDAMDRRFEETNEAHRGTVRRSGSAVHCGGPAVRGDERVNGPTSGGSQRWARDPTSASQQSMSDERFEDMNKRFDSRT